jgi:putative flavoprotein involved in K+ transport
MAEAEALSQRDNVMKRTDTIIIGGGQAGLAMSRSLADRAIEHVIFERGRIAERWRSERWDSLRLLTPNWQSRLPGWRYEGPDPDGYMTMPEVIDYLERYARSFAAPVQDETNVLSVRRNGRGYQVTTDGGTWTAGNVVIATGYSDVPYVPEMARRLPDRIFQINPTRYRNPSQLPPGGVLVVGASASGIQLADEIHRSGRPVTLAVGRHTRLPRMYRGKDILWWLDAMGSFDESIQEVVNEEASRHQPSLQLVGRPDHSPLDLPLLQDQGVRLVGRAVAVDGSRVLFSDDLIAYTAAADVKLARLLVRIEDFLSKSDFINEAGDAEPFTPFRWPAESPSGINLQAAGIRTVLWATGFRRRYPWLEVPILDERGEILHQGGVTPAPGLYVLGLQFLRRRKSAFIDGVGDDAAELTEHIAGRLATSRTAGITPSSSAASPELSAMALQ